MTITIYAHRGMWKSKVEQNSLHSINAAKKNGFSAEIDLRVQKNQIILAHDNPIQEIESVFEAAISTEIALALNIKMDGLTSILLPFKEAISKYQSFVFDGSIPEMYKFANNEIPHALRLSEYEREIPWESEFIWCDAFHDEWWINDKSINDYLESSKKIIFVSPELHSRDCSKSWIQFKQWKLKNLNFGVCTDFPTQLQEFLSND